MLQAARSEAEPSGVHPGLKIASLAGVAAPETVMAALERGFDDALADLVELARIPGVSAPGFDPEHVVRSAECVARLLERSGLDAGRAAAAPGRAPLRGGGEARGARRCPHRARVRAPRRAAARPPRALADAGLRADACARDGRLYGRGVVDDKAGLLLHVAALRAWLAAEGAPPLHVKLIVEGEEEIGSGHLAEFLRQHRERLAADVVVLSDTANLATGVPALTTSLRGLVAIDVTVRALDHPIHSGFWGGPVPDAATALARLLARLVDDAGVILVPGLLDDVPALDARERAALEALPCDEAAFRADAGMLPGTRFTGEPGAQPLRAPLVPAEPRLHGARGHAARDGREPADRRGERAHRRAPRSGSGCRARGAPPHGVPAPGSARRRRDRRRGS